MCCKEVRSGSCASPTQTIYPQDCSKSFRSSLSGRHSNDRQGMAFLKVWMAPCSYQCHTEEGRSHCSFSNSFGTRVLMGLATAPRTHVTNSVLHCTATSPETLKNRTKRRYADVPCKKCWWTNVSASCKKWPKRHGRLCGVYLVEPSRFASNDWVFSRSNRTIKHTSFTASDLTNTQENSGFDQ